MFFSEKCSQKIIRYIYGQQNRRFIKRMVKNFKEVVHKTIKEQKNILVQENINLVCVSVVEDPIFDVHNKLGVVKLRYGMYCTKEYRSRIL